MDSLRSTDWQLEAEQQLWRAYETAVSKQDGTLPTLVANVLVMDEDPAVRQNRLALLQHIASLANSIADLSQLEGF